MSDRRRAVVGVVVHTDPAALHGTLDALGDALRDGDRVLLVPDGPDPTMTDALGSDARLGALAAVWTAGDALPRGNAEAFNALAAARTSGEEAVVFLESGARPAADAIDRLRREWPHPVAFLIGSDAGLDRAVLDRARRVLSFGPMTLSHELARLVLYEQLYRALDIAAGGGYHK